MGGMRNIAGLYNKQSMEDHMKYVQTITSINVHPEGEATFHECATEVSIEEQGCGGYHIKLSQSSDNPMMEVICLDPEELDAVYAAAKQLLTQHNNDNGTTNTNKSVWSKCPKTV